MRISTAARSAACDAVVDITETGAGTAVVELYTGTAPATFGDAAAGTLLVSFDLADPAFGAASSGVATLLGVSISGTGVAAGDAGYGRLVNQNGDVLMDSEDVGTSGNIITMSTITVSVGLSVSLDSMTVTMPAGTA